MNESEKTAKPLVFHMEKCQGFRIIYAEGVFGGVAPRGTLRMTFFNEGSPIPEAMTFEVSNQQEGSIRVLKELKAERVTKKGIVRHLESEVVMPIESARKFHDWLGKKISEFDAKKMQRTAKQE